MDENTIAFAVELPNIDPANDTDVEPTDWRDYVISVRELEDSLQGQPFNKYDFLSNIPNELQNVIEQRPRTEILNWINNSSNISTASLLAAPDTAIGHNSFIEDSIFKHFDIESSGSSQVGVTEINIEESGFRQISPSQVGIAEVSISHKGLTEHRLNQNSTSQVSSLQNGFSKTDSLHVSPAKIRKAEIGIIHDHVAKIGIFENNVFKIGKGQFSFGQIDPSEISFSSSIPSEQFFSIHNSTPQIINELNNSATNIWSDLLQPETQLDINFQITDLPKGQLAEATITGFDSSGKLNAGTILIDYDAKR